MTQTADRESHYLDEFATSESRLQSEGPSWLYPLRKAAISHFADIGFPTKKVEDWKYTDITPITKLAARRPAAPGPAGEAWRSYVLPGPYAVFVDGFYSEELSDLSGLPAGCQVKPLKVALYENEEVLSRLFGKHSPILEEAFPALNCAFFQDGLYVELDRDVVVEGLVQMIFVASGQAEPAAISPRNVIVAGQGSKLQVCETYIGSGTSFTNVVTEVLTEESASVDHYKVQNESETAYHISYLRCHSIKAGHFGSHFYSFGGKLVRNEIVSSLKGAGGHCDLNGLFIVDGTRNIDCHTTLHHEEPHCTSWEMYRGVLDHHATGNFLGKINVYPDAQKTDAKQSSSNLLLSSDASINAKPCLEIYADDVRCTHGATVGQLDPMAEFYLRTRGISAIDARNLLIHAFAGEVVDDIPIEALRNRVKELMDSRLPGGAARP